jgi:hypothetical protein
MASLETDRLKSDGLRHRTSLPTPVLTALEDLLKKTYRNHGWQRFISTSETERPLTKTSYRHYDRFIGKKVPEWNRLGV